MKRLFPGLVALCQVVVVVPFAMAEDDSTDSLKVLAKFLDVQQTFQKGQSTSDARLHLQVDDGKPLADIQTAIRWRVSDQIHESLGHAATGDWMLGLVGEYRFDSPNSEGDSKKHDVKAGISGTVHPGYIEVEFQQKVVLDQIGDTTGTEGSLTLTPWDLDWPVGSPYTAVGIGIGSFRWFVSATGGAKDSDLGDDEKAVAFGGANLAILLDFGDPKVSLPVGLRFDLQGYRTNSVDDFGTGDWHYGIATSVRFFIWSGEGADNLSFSVTHEYGERLEDDFVESNTLTIGFGARM